MPDPKPDVRFRFDRALDCLATPEHPGAHAARTVTALRPSGLAEALERLPPAQAAWARERGFAAREGELLPLPGDVGVAGALLGLGEADRWFAYGGLAQGLGRAGAAGPEGGPDADRAPLWRLDLPAGADPGEAVLGFCLGAYRFEPFRRTPAAGRALLLPPPPDVQRAVAIAEATWLARDLINMPANRLGPAELADAACAVADRFGAALEVVEGEALRRRFPAIAAVGAGSARPPRAVLARWRGSAATDDSPLLSIVGKGVVFDTGGYDLKPSSAMLRMKKDMGGAAIALALARLVMGRDLPLRLELRLGCVENSVSGTAMRPSDVIETRHGLSVEIGNTDAEGRLVLCDLLSEACEASPSLLVDAATLTGAARVALGPDLPALFCNDDAAAASMLSAGERCHDPLWRLPLWPPYDEWLSGTVADLNNVSSRPMAGAVVAALFLQRFVAGTIRWVHLDTYAWNDSARPGRPEGGEALGLRALFEGSLRILNLDGDPKHSGNVMGTEPRDMKAL